MGTWDVGPFDNDTAADFSGDLDDAAESERAGIIRSALARVLITHDHLDQDIAVEAVAAAALVAGQCPARRARHHRVRPGPAAPRASRRPARTRRPGPRPCRHRAVRTDGTLGRVRQGARLAPDAPLPAASPRARPAGAAVMGPDRRMDAGPRPGLVRPARAASRSGRNRGRPGRDGTALPGRPGGVAGLPRRADRVGQPAARPAAPVDRGHPGPLADARGGSR